MRLDGRHFSTLEAGELQETQFRINTTGLAETEDDAIIYNSTTGQLYYDVGGSGGADAIEFAVLENLELIDHSDIFIF
ncbi:hypothetical protein [Neptunicoccus cionae]|uniref:hypothetical protein n=1 Tax=Neptunicoccus cionae TaxID=2035344 RepID=UPI001E6081F1|nr:hypothetical protein [Amylibacter cionae]